MPLIRCILTMLGLRRPLHFYWIGEESEVYVAHSLQEALDEFAQPEDLEERAYGELDRRTVMHFRDEETGQPRVATLAELGWECRVVPNIVLSQYC
ncbi:hypothetical protein [Burkholderia phage CSP3]|nr:hypothetical protein [Burkholderia phage CSP3]